MRVALIFFTPGGEALARKIIKALQSTPGRSITIFDKTRDTARKWVQREFRSSDVLVFIGAAGIAVRLLDGLPRSKDRDPAVLVLDEKGEFVIPLLSGHMGGANNLARELARLLEARAVITTATDCNGVFAVDEWAIANGCVIEGIAAIKHISGTLLRGGTVGFHSDFPVSGPLPEGLVTGGENPAGVCVSFDGLKKPFATTLNCIPRIISLGAGCTKGTNPKQFETFVLRTLDAYALSPKALATLASIDIKAQEPCFLAFAEKYGLAFQIFSAKTLNAVQGTFSSSPFVQEKTGTDNVCERAASAAAKGRLLVRKTVCDGMTVALAAAEWTCTFAALDGDSTANPLTGDGIL